MKHFISVLLLGIVGNAFAQSLSVRSHDFTVDLKDPRKETTIPLITWAEPASETIFQREEELPVRIEVSSSSDIKVVTIGVRRETQGLSRGTMIITPKEGEKKKLVIERSFAIPQGVNQLEIVVENVDGVKSKSFREVHVGTVALDNAAKLGRQDYALLFLTDRYDNWDSLVNPVADGRAIAAIIEKKYGFKVDIVENPSQDQIFRKIRAYSEQKYKPLDQFMIFFAGHGYFDESFKEGFVVVKESLQDDPGKTSYVSYSRLRTILNSIPCEHVLLLMDVCFGGTFDEKIASGRSRKIGEVSRSEFIVNKLSVKTRKCFTSGGKTYVSDGIAGHHSPFAERLLSGLNSGGGNDGILTLAELYGYVEWLDPKPHLLSFGDDVPSESEFVFIVK